LQARNLNELFYDSKSVKPSDFVNTKHFKTMIAIVPDNEVNRYLAEYESINEFIVPGSSK
jgi:V-ATPase subunit C